MKLYEIPQAWQQLQDALTESSGELTPEIEALWAHLEDDGAAKVESAACVLRHMKAESEFLADEIGRLQARKSATENAQERLRTLVLPAVVALGGKVKTARFTVFTTTRKNWSIELAPGADIWNLPDHFYRTREPELAKMAIKKALEDGLPCPPDLIAVPVENVSLTVR